MRYTAEESTGMGVSGRDVTKHVAKEIKRAKHIVYVGIEKGRKRYTTPAILKQETRLLRSAGRLASGRSHRITLRKMAVRLSIKSAPATGQWLALDTNYSLNADQRQAIRQIAQKSGQLALLTTRARTPRTETLARLGKFYEAAGYQVFAIGHKRGQTRILGERTDLPALPLRSLLYMAENDLSFTGDIKHAAKQLIREGIGRYIGLKPFSRTPLLNQKSVLVIDHAERISTQDMSRLLYQSRRWGCKVVLAGNVQAQQSLTRGGPFASMARLFPHAELTEPAWTSDRATVEDARAISRGNAKELVEKMKSQGRLHTANSTAAATNRLLDDWKAAGGTANPEEHLIVVSNAQQALRVNQLASRLRREASTAKRKSDPLILPSGEEIFAGDRVVCTRNSRRYGVDNGNVGVVLGVSKRLNAIQVKLDGGDRVTLPIIKFPHVTRAFAVTVSHATHTRHAYLLLSNGWENRQSALAKFSLASDSTRAYVDTSVIGDDLSQLIRQMSTDATKTLATEIRRAERDEHHR